MTNHSTTVAAQNGRASIRDLPRLSGSQDSDHLLTVRDDTVGLLPASSVTGSTSIDLSAYATRQDVTNEQTARTSAFQSLEERIKALGQPSSAAAPTVVTDIVGLPSPKAPVVGWMARRYDGGANIEGSLSFPATFPQFALPPMITGLGWVLSDEEWRGGQTGTAQNLTITGGSVSGFTFRHTGVWPGYGKEFLLFRIEGFPL